MIIGKFRDSFWDCAFPLTPLQEACSLAALMKSTLLLPIITLAIAAAASAQETKPADPKPGDAKPAAEAPAPVKLDPVMLKDRVSYFYGSDVGKSLRDNKVEVNAETLIQGIKDTLEDKKPGKYTEKELEEAMTQFAQAMMAKQQATTAAAATANIEEGKKFLETNGKKEGVKTTESGLQYEVLKKADGAKPTANDTVTVHYEGKLISGKVFDSSIARKEPATFPLNGVIPGWTEGVQLMNVGSKFKFTIPSKLAYGERGAGPDIGPNSTLVFEVELLSIGADKAGGAK